ncbi:hypothetical protein FN846DRAFT_962024 [Sphaerosporella brunnea]|uniref:Uncharacterized protein n=1 Tax=Sphaerosporella brunnea TaxID=1250544 RepID=A0A5J5EMY3_9PEZI|nr:hypothetical protein FN846DRAFT_962024 [Sphaerosporella brunnea]
MYIKPTLLSLSPQPPPPLTISTTSNAARVLAPMSLWNYYKSQHPRTRMLLGAGVVVYACAGLYVSDWVERRWFGEDPEQRPPLVRVVAVERGK